MHTPEGHLPRDLLSGMRCSRWTISFYRKTTPVTSLKSNFFALFNNFFGLRILWLAYANCGNLVNKAESA
jgi:hypothetical protein